MAYDEYGDEEEDDLDESGDKDSSETDEEGFD
jgi:hypothetical protein